MKVFIENSLEIIGFLIRNPAYRQHDELQEETWHRGKEKAESSNEDEHL